MDIASLLHTVSSHIANAFPKGPYQSRYPNRYLHQIILDASNGILESRKAQPTAWHRSPKYGMIDDIDTRERTCRGKLYDWVGPSRAPVFEANTHGGLLQKCKTREDIHILAFEVQRSSASRNAEVFAITVRFLLEYRYVLYRFLRCIRLVFSHTPWLSFHPFHTKIHLPEH